MPGGWSPCSTEPRLPTPPLRSARRSKPNFALMHRPKPSSALVRRRGRPECSWRLLLLSFFLSISSASTADRRRFLGSTTPCRPVPNQRRCACVRPASQAVARRACPPLLFIFSLLLLLSSLDLSLSLYFSLSLLLTHAFYSVCLSAMRRELIEAFIERDGVFVC